MSLSNNNTSVIISKENFFELLPQKSKSSYKFDHFLDQLLELRKTHKNKLYCESSDLLQLFWYLEQSAFAHPLAKALVDPFFNNDINPVFSLICLEEIHEDLSTHTLGDQLLFYTNNMHCNIEIDFHAIQSSTNKELSIVLTTEQYDYLIQQNQYDHLQRFHHVHIFGNLPQSSHDLSNLYLYTKDYIDFQTLINCKKRCYKGLIVSAPADTPKFQQDELNDLFTRLDLKGQIYFSNFPYSFEPITLSKLIDGFHGSSYLNSFFYLYFEDFFRVKDLHKDIITPSDLYIGDVDLANHRKIFSKLDLSLPELSTLKQSQFKLYINQYNFFRLGTILNSIFSTQTRDFQIKSAGHLLNEFMEYLYQLKRAYPSVLFSFLDSTLIEILHIISNYSSQLSHHTNPNEDTYTYLLRLLGICCDHAFVGPQSIHIDVTSKCNTKCTFCGYHTDLINDKPWTENGWSEKELDFEVFTRFVDDLVDLKSNEDVLLTGGGEPLMHPKILDMVSYLRANDVYTILFTNGLLLKKYTVNQLVDLGLNKIYWSIHSASSSTWLMQHSGSNPNTFQMVIDQMNYLIDYKKQKQLSSPDIVLVNAISAVNAHEVMDLVDLAIDLKVDHLRLQVVHQHNEQTKHLLLTKYQLQRLNKQLPEIEQKLKDNNVLLLDNISYQISNLLENIENTEIINDDWSYNKYNQSGCFIGYLFTRTWVDGTMSYCCHDRVVDNLENGFKDVWTSDKYNEYRFISKHFDDTKNVLLEKDNRGSWLLGKDCNSCGNYELIDRANQALSISGLANYVPIGMHEVFENQIQKNMDLDHQSIIFGQKSYKPKEFMHFGGV
ncbi:MAG: radical SAM protein [Candidatus Cloacimonetes bacterium]|nr:radical SAM protein [Candidatus Cloacimonadota bacterium]